MPKRTRDDEDLQWYPDPLIRREGAMDMHLQERLESETEGKEFWLPKELWEVVATHLGDAREVLNFGSVCKSWWEISKEPRVVRGLIEARWPRIASLDGLLKMRRGNTEPVGRANEMLELYEELHRQALEGGSNHRLNFFNVKGPKKKLEHAWTYQPRETVYRLLHFEGAVFVLLTDRDDLEEGEQMSSWLHVLDAQTSRLLAEFTVDAQLKKDERGYSWNLDISDKHRLLVVTTPNLIQACHLDALLAPSSVGGSNKRKLPAISWKVKTRDSIVAAMAVVDVYSRVYLMLSFAGHSAALCAVSLLPRDGEVTYGSVSAVGTEIEWYYCLPVTHSSISRFSVVTEDDVLAFSIPRESHEDRVMIVGPLSLCSGMASSPRVTSLDLGACRTDAVVINGCLVCNNKHSFRVHSLEGELLFQAPDIQGLVFPLRSFLHPQENIKLAFVIPDQGPSKLVKCRFGVEAASDPLMNWSPELDLQSRHPLAQLAK